MTVINKFPVPVSHMLTYFVDRDSASRLERLRKICCWSEYLNTAQQGNLAVLLAKIFVKDPNKRPGLKYIKEKLEEM